MGPQGGPATTHHRQGRGGGVPSIYVAPPWSGTVRYIYTCNVVTRFGDGPAWEERGGGEYDVTGDIVREHVTSRHDVKL